MQLFRRCQQFFAASAGLVDVDGGRLEIDWRDDGVWMTGPTALVFEARLTPAFLASI